MTTNTVSEKSLWPRGIVTVFILLALFDSYIITKAIQTGTGTLSDNPYQSSLDYQEIINLKDATNKAGLSFDIKYENGLLKSDINGLNEKSGMILKLRMIRPDNPALDKNLEIHSDNGSFIYEFPDLKRGLWMIEAKLSSLRNNNENYYFEKKELFN